MSFRRADADSWRRKGAEGAAGGRPGTMANEDAPEQEKAIRELLSELDGGIGA